MEKLELIIIEGITIIKMTRRNWGWATVLQQETQYYNEQTIVLSKEALASKAPSVTYVPWNDGIARKV